MSMNNYHLEQCRLSSREGLQIRRAGDVRLLAATTDPKRKEFFKNEIAIIDACLRREASMSLGAAVVDMDRTVRMLNDSGAGASAPPKRPASPSTTTRPSTSTAPAQPKEAPMNQRDTQTRNEILALCKCTTKQRQVLMSLSTIAEVEDTIRAFGIEKSLHTSVSDEIDERMGLATVARSDFHWEGNDRVFPCTLTKEEARATMRRNAGRVSR